jgi:hypothetical protein
MRFFVLTKHPMATCPFCETETEWPDDIAAIYARHTITPVAFNVPILVTGVLELGTFEDTELDFVSRLRLTDTGFVRV